MHPALKTVLPDVSGQLSAETTLAQHHEVGAGIVQRAESFHQQQRVFLRLQAAHANEQKRVASEPLLLSPTDTVGHTSTVVVNRYAIRDHSLALQAIYALKTSGDLLRDRHGNHQLPEREPLDDLSEPVRLILRQIVQSVHYHRDPAPQQSG